MASSVDGFEAGVYDRDLLSIHKNEAFIIRLFA